MTTDLSIKQQLEALDEVEQVAIIEQQDKTVFNIYLAYDYEKWGGSVPKHQFEDAISDITNGLYNEGGYFRDRTSKVTPNPKYLALSRKH